MLKHSATYEYPADDVMELICSEEFEVEQQRRREDVVDACYEVQQDDERTLRFSVPYRHYKRSRTGRLDRDRTESSRTDYELDRASRTLRWWHRGESEEGLARVEGTTRFVPLGEQRCRIDREVTIDIRIPLVGKAIAKVVEGEFKKSYEEAGGRIAEMLAKRQD